MAMQIQVTHYDPATKKYMAQLTVTDEVSQTVRTYFCEGSWHDEDAPMAAQALYEQHTRNMAQQAGVEAEKQAIAGKIAAEIDKLAATEVK